MIATCIAMAIWTSGLLFMTLRAEKARQFEEASAAVAEKGFGVSEVEGDTKT